MSVQNGYGFVHYPLTAEGINSALTAVKSLHQVTINQITFDCSVSNQLNQVLANMEKNSSGGVGGNGMNGFSPSNNNRNRRPMNLNQMSGFQPDSRSGNNRSFTLNNGMAVNTTIPTVNNSYPSPAPSPGYSSSVMMSGGRGLHSTSGYSLPLPPMMNSSPRDMQPAGKQFYPPTHVHAPVYDQSKANHAGGMNNYPNFVSPHTNSHISANYGNPRGPTVFSFSSADLPAADDISSFASDRDTQSHLSSFHASRSDTSSYSSASSNQQKLQQQSSYHPYYSDFPADDSDSPNNLHLPFPPATAQQQHQQIHHQQQQQGRTRYPSNDATDDMLNSLIASTENLNVDRPSSRDSQQYGLKQQFSQLAIDSHPILSVLANESAEFNNEQQDERKCSSPPSSHHSSNASKKSSRSNSRESANLPPGLIGSNNYNVDNNGIYGYSPDNHNESNHDFISSNPPPYSYWS
jgi:hypothetical protein